MTSWMRAVATALVVTLATPALAPSMGAAMESIARVTKLRRLGERARAVRGPRQNAPREVPRLLQLVPKISPHLQEPTHLEPVADAFERSLTETVEVCISVPPRHGKTTLILHAIVWILLHNPRAQILYASYAHNFAAKQVRKAMRLAVAAGLKLGKTQRRDEWETAEGGFVKACGVGGQITGEGFTHIIVDDPHKSRAEAESRQIRERVVEGFRDDIYTRQDPRGTSVFVVHTRWHEYDLIGELTRAPIDEDAAPPFQSINLPALLPHVGPANDDTYDGMRALAPSLFGVQRLIKIRSRLGEYGWISLFMGSPRPRGGTLFHDAVLVESFLDHASFRYAIGVDLARTAKTRSDYNVAVVLRKNVETGDVDIVEMVRMQGRIADQKRPGEIDTGFASKLAALQGRYGGARGHMYTGQAEDLVLQLMGQLAENACEVEAHVATSEKYLRAQPYAAAWAAGRIRMLRSAPWANELVHEHVAFTGEKGERDDIVDACAAAFDALDGDNVHEDFVNAMRGVRR